MKKKDFAELVFSAIGNLLEFFSYSRKRWH